MDLLQNLATLHGSPDCGSRAISIPHAWERLVVEPLQHTTALHEVVCCMTSTARSIISGAHSHTA